MRLATLYSKTQMSALCRGAWDVASTGTFVLDLSSDEVDDTYPKCRNREEIVMIHPRWVLKLAFIFYPLNHLPITNYSKHTIFHIRTTRWSIPSLPNSNLGDLFNLTCAAQPYCSMPPKTNAFYETPVSDRTLFFELFFPCKSFSYEISLFRYLSISINYATR